MKIAVLGSGTWGCALARLLCNNGHAVTLWSTTEEKSRSLRESLSHPKLPGAVLPAAIDYTADLAAACGEKDLILFTVASSYIRSTAERVKPYIRDGQALATAAKGMEKGTLLTMSEVIESVMAPMKIRIAAISGPTHAEEVALDMPTAMVCASEDEVLRQQLSQALSTGAMRMYTGTDIRGVEVCGALKNIVALCAGMAKGLGFGDNALAAIIARGMTEIKRLGMKMGCDSESFDGLAGIGDLIVTCFSGHSRNRTAGFLMGQGLSMEDAVKEVGMVVEGIHALDAAMELCRRYDVYMPITMGVYAIVREGKDPRMVAEHLMVHDRTVTTW